MPIGIAILADNNGNVFSPTNGYTKLPSQYPSYRTLIIASVSVDCLETLLWDIVDSVFDSELLFVLSINEEKTFESSWLNKNYLKQLLQPFMFRLLNDGAVEFGLVRVDENFYEEVRIEYGKVLLIMTSKEQIIEELFNQYHIPYMESLKIITDSPHALMNLRAAAKFASGYEWLNLTKDEFLTEIYTSEIVSILKMQQIDE
ncbi:hypothetical protein JYQ62_14905 [Nostoc sp. UHCC 0702]|nr:hypothetical protein JYQ62_14905 [Nostoc sp. UHCC 0702]